MNVITVAEAKAFSLTGPKMKRDHFLLVSLSSCTTLQSPPRHKQLCSKAEQNCNCFKSHFCCLKIQHFKIKSNSMQVYLKLLKSWYTPRYKYLYACTHLFHSRIVRHLFSPSEIYTIFLSNMKCPCIFGDCLLFKTFHLIWPTSVTMSSNSDNT